ncbi:hypothetical protein SAMN04515619_101365 [Collimonas sp. OK412]|nr:hypothetical protein SAMN04515619_101365 [Collimonas sp. OK412]
MAVKVACLSCKKYSIKKLNEKLFLFLRIVPTMAESGNQTKIQT